MTQTRIPKFLQYALGLAAIALFILPLKVVGGALGLAAMTSFADVDFSDEEVRTLADVVMDEAFAQPSINEFHTIQEGLITGKQIVYAGLLEKITKADDGCGTGATSQAIEFRQKSWSPKAVKVWMQLCANEFEQTLMIYSKKKGVDVDDLTGTDIMEFIVSHMKPAMLEDAFRIAWFNDTEHSNVSDSGGTMVITDGVSLTDYMLIDGLWNQIFAIAAADSNRRVTIAANATGSKTLQDTLGSSVAVDTFRALLQNADYRLQGKDNKVIICTQSLFNNYVTYCETQNLETSFKYLQGGMPSVQFRGVTVIAWNFWDRTIRADFDNGTTWYRPHRALLTTKENLMIGLDTSSALSDLKIWYNDDTEKNNAKGKYKIDAKVVIDYLVQVAY